MLTQISGKQMSLVLSLPIIPPKHVINIKEPIFRFSEFSTIARIEGGHKSSESKKKEINKFPLTVRNYSINTNGNYNL